MIIGHRFGNNLRLLRAAADAGADYVEADVWYYRGRLEVRHARTAGRLPVLWDKWWIRRRRPNERLTLDEVLSALPDGMGIMLDLKGNDRRLPDAILDALRRHGHGHPVMVSSRFWDYLPSLREFPEILLFFSVGRPWEMWRVRPLLDERENDAVCVKYTMLDAEKVRELKTQVALVSTWGINDERRLRDCLEWGVDAIITDEVDIMRRVTDLRPPRSAAG